MALRFARVIRYREDKKPADVDTVQAVRAIHLGPDLAEEGMSDE
jgi:DNA ligase-1